MRLTEVTTKRSNILMLPTSTLKVTKALFTPVRSLRFLNPWWDEEEWWRKDRQLRMWLEGSYRWIPTWIREIPLEPFSLTFVTGPRQVGKTTGLKLLIKEAIDRGWDPVQITYVNVEIFPSLEHFGGFLLDFLEERRASTRILILDEVTSLPGWWKPLKSVIDSDLTRKVVIIATGSSSLRLRRDTDVFPGRRGRGINVEVLPLSYPEVKRVRGADCEWFLEYGGYPRAVKEDFSVYGDLIEGIKREVALAKRDPSLALEILEVLVEKAPSPVSYNTVAKEVDTSHSVVREYVHMLQELYIVRIVPPVGRHHRRKMKKIILRDPGMANLLGDPPLSVRLEWVVQEHVARRYGEVYYYRRNGEVNVVAGGKRWEMGLRKRGKDVINMGNCASFLEEILPPQVEVAEKF